MRQFQRHQTRRILDGDQSHRNASAAGATVGKKTIRRRCDSSRRSISGRRFGISAAEAKLGGADVIFVLSIVESAAYK
jgi:hypothetical protein